MAALWDAVRGASTSIAEKSSVAREKIARSKAAGYASDTVAAGYGVGLHTLGGAAMGGAINAAAYADDGHALTSAESLGSAFASGAGYGGAAGLGLGLIHSRKYAAMNAAKRAGNKQTGIWSGIQKRRTDADEMYANEDANWARQRLSDRQHNVQRDTNGKVI